MQSHEWQEDDQIRIYVISRSSLEICSDDHKYDRFVKKGQLTGEGTFESCNHPLTTQWIKEQRKRKRIKIRTNWHKRWNWHFRKVCKNVSSKKHAFIIESYLTTFGRSALRLHSVNKWKFDNEKIEGDNFARPRRSKHILLIEEMLNLSNWIITAIWIMEQLRDFPLILHGCYSFLTLSPCRACTLGDPMFFFACCACVDQ
jgi:kynurenine formamidase